LIPPKGVPGSPRNIPIPFGVKKTRMTWLADGGKSLMIYAAVSTQYRRVTDRRTDRRTDILRGNETIEILDYEIYYHCSLL